MSPVNRHLEFVELSDFSPGLWTNANQQPMPASAAQIMTDCQPEVGGGIRASYKPAALTTSGISGTLVPTALYCKPLFVGNFFFLFGYEPGTNVAYVYTLNQNAGETSWTARQAFTASGGSGTLGQNGVDLFVDSVGTQRVVFAHYSDQADGGVWASTIPTSGAPTLAQVLPMARTGVCVSQDDRVIASVGDSSLFARVLRWTDSQSVISWPAANNLTLQASRDGNDICTILPTAPSDLLVGSTGSAWMLVQGSINNPVVRSMSDAVQPIIGHRPQHTDDGVAFVGAEGIYVTNDGGSFTELSSQIDPQTFGGARGGLSFMDHLLLTQLGYFYDHETKSWFRSSVLTTGRQSNVVRPTRQMFAFTSAAAGFGIYMFTFGGGYAGQRWNTYTWKSAPMHDAAGRWLGIREVQVILRANDSSAQVAVTVNGTTRTVTGIAAGRQNISFLFQERAEQLDVQVVPTAGSSSNEAPTIEKVRIGAQPNTHQSY